MIAISSSLKCIPPFRSEATIQNAKIENYFTQKSVYNNLLLLTKRTDRKILTNINAEIDTINYHYIPIYQIDR